jgi:hypothetical protein
VQKNIPTKTNCRKTFNNLKTFELQKKIILYMVTFSSNDICFGKKWGVSVKLWGHYLNNTYTQAYM